MDRYVESNRRLWDEWTAIHEASDFYDLESFKHATNPRPDDAGPGVRVRRFEVEEIGEVRGKDLLHLQCHFGIDTLSWARLGANVTGMDFSDAAIALGRSMAEELGLSARFVQSTVEDLPSNLDGDFDIVYTSRGAIWWLADLGRWAQVIAHFLRPGGTFYMTEFHPVLQALDDTASEPRVRYPYFPRAEPQRFAVHGSYAEPTASISSVEEFGWQHSIGQIVTSIADAGLRVELLHEFDWVDHRYVSWLEEGTDGRWRLPAHVEGELPLMYSVRARKS